MAIRDLWRSYGLSVRVEQHSKTLLTKWVYSTTKLNQLYFLLLTQFILLPFSLLYNCLALSWSPSWKSCGLSSLTVYLVICNLNILSTKQSLLSPLKCPNMAKPRQGTIASGTMQCLSLQSFIYFGKIYYFDHLLTFLCFVISVNNHTYFLNFMCTAGRKQNWESVLLKAQNFIGVERDNKLNQDNKSTED